ncbi:hypothetical protein [Paenibacillus dakarensis]|uniref:hypothetical protein n=1 Tax=Paenibacillus dakarensis TaxID=1527293 RepID=UPI0006D531BA|nr:hypothetical protein [Paenibacillus dakarensis]
MNEIEIDMVTLDSAVKMLKLTYSLELWDQLVDLSDKLYIKTTYLYKNRSSYTYKIKTERPLVYYYGYSLLMKGLALKELGNYESALQCIDQYANLHWFEELNEVSLDEVQYYQYISEPNRYEILLLSGDFSILNPYVDFLKRNPKEILPGMGSIIKAANTYRQNINHIIHSFSQEINQSILNSPKELVYTAYHHSFLVQIIKYKIHHAEYVKAIDYTLRLMLSSHLADNDKLYKFALVSFESIRNHATENQLDQFIAHISTISGKVVI